MEYLSKIRKKTTLCYTRCDSLYQLTSSPSSKMIDLRSSKNCITYTPFKDSFHWTVLSYGSFCLHFFSQYKKSGTWHFAWRPPRKRKCQYLPCILVACLDDFDRISLKWVKGSLIQNVFVEEDKICSFIVIFCMLMHFVKPERYDSVDWSVTHIKVLLREKNHCWS